MSNSETGKPTPPKRPQQVQLTEMHLKQQLQEQGMLGKLFGSSEHTQIYIAGLVAVSMIVLIAATLFVPIADGIPKWEILQWLGGILLAALGYIFGSTHTGSRH